MQGGAGAREDLRVTGTGKVLKDARVMRSFASPHEPGEALTAVLLVSTFGLKANLFFCWMIAIILHLFRVGRGEPPTLGVPNGGKLGIIHSPGFPFSLFIIIEL